MRTKWIEWSPAIVAVIIGVAAVVTITLSAKPRTQRPAPIVDFYECISKEGCWSLCVPPTCNDVKVRKWRKGDIINKEAGLIPVGDGWNPPQSKAKDSKYGKR